jgi:hypothetical protein
MAVDHIRYDLLAQEALRGVLRTVLTDAAKNGLPGDHHFFVTFDTCAEGVRLSQRMRAQYPKEMTVVLQHQFWDLGVTEDAFEVGLSFGGVPERLSVPFAAVKKFFDPSVEFGLEFEQVDLAAAEAAAKPDSLPAPKTSTPNTGALKTSALKTSAPRTSAPKTSAAEPALSTKQAKPRRTTPAAPANPQAASDDQSAVTEKPATGGGEVVRLDRFRKK